MTLLVLAAISAIFAVIPCLLFLMNLVLYRRPPALNERALPSVSVLIPARNEEQSIQSAVESALRSTNIDFEIIVMDDASTDRTAAIVSSIAARDPRVRLEHAPSLPSGWNGKQHACWALAHAARNPVLCFVDADVRLEPEALARMAAFLDSSSSALVSGFPRQETETTLEWLLLPLIHFVLLCFLPISAMRRGTDPAFAAGCGQFLMVRKDAYFQSGGHASIRTTMHDGLLLPRLLRSHGFRTDLADLTTLATCRMYRNAGEVWRGLAKNATEGIAAPNRILPITLMLFAGQVLPLCLAPWLLTHSTSATVRAFTSIALASSYLPRLISTVRYRQPMHSALLHPLGIATLLVLEWYALVRKLTGFNATWKAREYPAG